MTDYSFRVRFLRSPRDTIDVDAQRLEFIDESSSKVIVVASNHRDQTIKDATTWVLKGSGWPTEESAAEAGCRYEAALVRTLACLHIGADWGSRAPQSMAYHAGLRMLAREGQRLLNDVHGLMTFETDPNPAFATVGNVSLIRGIPSERFVAAFKKALHDFEPMSPEERLAAELYGASFFQENADSRFLLLMIAVEALLDPAPRPESVRDHVHRMIALTKEATLPEHERSSLLSSLDRLRSESIGQSGKRLARERLASRTYDNREPGRFFRDCYDLRSHLVHGIEPIPTRADVAAAAAQLEHFVGDLLAGPVLAAEE